jgi:hypothetical protein
MSDHSTFLYLKEEYLQSLVTERRVLLHGSNEIDLEILRPHPANDAVKRSGSKNAVYAVDDPVLAIFYAIQDRSKIYGVIHSAVKTNLETGERGYRFGMPRAVLQKQPWKTGAVYIVDSSAFVQCRNDAGRSVREWASEQPVSVSSKLIVGPEDFRFLNQVQGYGD